MPALSLLERGGRDNLDGMKAYLQRLPERPTAMLCYNDIIAIECVKALEALKLSVPDDISVCGYDDRDMVEHLSPSLTTVRYPRHEIAAKAADILLEKIAGTLKPQEFQRVELKPTLVVRESTKEVGA